MRLSDHKFPTESKTESLISAIFCADQRPLLDFQPFLTHHFIGLEFLGTALKDNAAMAHDLQALGDA